MIRMEIRRIKKETARKRIAKYQQLTRREGKKNDNGENVRRGCDTAD